MIMPSTSEKQPLEAFPKLSCGAIHLPGEQQKRTDFDGQHSEGEYDVWWAEDLHRASSPSGGLPPVIERRRGDHGEAAPGATAGSAKQRRGTRVRSRRRPRRAELRPKVAFRRSDRRT
jgi:hypothetical protein